MQSCELVATITAIACAIANTCSEEEVAVLASAFSQLGDTLATILAQESCINSHKDEKKYDFDSECAKSHLNNKEPDWNKDVDC